MQLPELFQSTFEGKRKYLYYEGECAYSYKMETKSSSWAEKVIFLLKNCKNIKYCCIESNDMKTIIKAKVRISGCQKV